MNYRVEIDNHGPAGDVRYIEDDRVLRLFWEYMSYGVLISVPDSGKWDEYYQSHSAGWAKDRREEILQRVAEQACLQQAPWSKVAITEEGIELRFR